MRKLDLRDGKPVWLSYRTTKIPEKRLDKDASVEVLVIGAGISGAMSADLLTEAGHDVMVIDRRGASLGSTPATTALVQFEIDIPIKQLAAKIGMEKALRAWRRSRLAVGNLRDRIEELAFDCRMEAKATLYLAGNTLTGTALREEADLRAAAGLSARYLTHKALMEAFQIDREGAILSGGNLALDPVKLTNGLLFHAEKRGASIYAPEEATQIDTSREEVRVLLASGREIHAKHVILATGYELMAPVKENRHSIISTWAIATKRQPKAALWPKEAMIWEASDPYLYMRTTYDGRIICGGEDEDFRDEAHRNALTGEKSKRIAQKLAKLFPHIDTTPDYAWAGSFGTMPTGLPIIGPLPDRPRLFAIMGYGGNGITFSRIAAEAVCSYLAGKPDVDADIFAF